MGASNFSEVQSSTEPFPHWIFSDAWNEGLLDQVVSEVPLESDPRWKRYQSKLEGKLEARPDPLEQNKRGAVRGSRC